MINIYVNNNKPTNQNNLVENAKVAEPIEKINKDEATLSKTLGSFKEQFESGSYQALASYLGLGSEREKQSLSANADIPEKDFQAIYAKTLINHANIQLLQETNINTISGDELNKFVNNPKGWPALHYAIDQKRFDIAVLIIQLYPKQVDLFTPDVQLWWEHLGNDAASDHWYKGGVDKGISALELAVKNGGLELAQLLVEKGCDPNVGHRETGHWDGDLMDGENGEYSEYTPLYWAIKNHQPTMVELLLTAGANPQNSVYSYRSPWGKMGESHEDALLLAAKEGDESILRLLISARMPEPKMKPDELSLAFVSWFKSIGQNSKNLPALDFVLENNDLESFKTLLNYRVMVTGDLFKLALKKEDPMYCELLFKTTMVKNDWTLLVSIDAQRMDCIEHLLPYGHKNGEALRKAVLYKDIALVKLLLDNGFNDPLALATAIKTKQSDMVHLLFERFGPQEKQDNLFTKAIQTDNFDLALFLYEPIFKKWNYYNQSEWAVLQSAMVSKTVPDHLYHFAIEMKRGDLLKDLVDNQSIDKTMCDALLRHAIDSKQPKVVDYLIQVRSELHQTGAGSHSISGDDIIQCVHNSAKWPALHYAIEQKRFDVASLFIQLYPKQIQELTPSIGIYQWTAGKDKDVLVSVGVDKGISALELAAKNEHFELAQLLLEKGCNPDMGHRESGVLENGYKNKDKGQYSETTPLYWAIKNQQPEMVELLLKAGANSQKPIFTLFPEWGVGGIKHEDALILAVNEGNESILRSLMASRMPEPKIKPHDIDASLVSWFISMVQNDKGVPPLEFALQNNDLKSFNTLISYGFNVNEEQFKQALLKEDPAYCEVLFLSGQMKNDGALLASIDAKRVDCIERLLPHGLKNGEALKKAVLNKDLTLVKLLLNNGYANPVALATAIQTKQSEMMHLLFEKFSPVVKENNLFTKAVQNDNFELAQFLYDACLLKIKTKSEIDALQSVMTRKVYPSDFYKFAVKLKRADLLKEIVDYQGIDKTLYDQLLKSAINTKRKSIVEYLNQITPIAI